MGVWLGAWDTPEVWSSRGRAGLPLLWKSCSQKRRLLAPLGSFPAGRRNRTAEEESQSSGHPSHFFKEFICVDSPGLG